MAEQRGRPPGRLRQRARRSVLGNREFRWLWSSLTVSVAGDQIFPIAVTISVLDAGGGAGEVGLVLAARWLAIVMFSLFGGVWADRLSRRAVMVVAHAAQAGIVAAVVVAPRPPMVVLALAVFLAGSAEAFYRPAFNAMLAAVVPPAQRAAANGLASVSWRLGAVVGPGVGAAVVTLTSPRLTFAAAAVMFALSFGFLFFLREPRYEPAPRGSMLGEIREGIAEVTSRPWLAAVLVVAALQLMIAVGPGQVLLPIISRREFGSDVVYGTALALFSAGGLAGALIAMARTPRHQGQAGVLALLTYAFVPIGLLFPVSPWMLYACYIVGGLGLEIFIVQWQVALQREIPPERLARVTSLDFMASFALMPLGLALVGPAVRFAGEGAVLGAALAVSVVPVLFLLLVPGVRDFHLPPRGGETDRAAIRTRPATPPASPPPEAAGGR